MESLDWKIIYDMADPDSAYNLFIELLSEAYDIAFPYGNHCR